jgi:antitoxin component of RelBE/YafQ-DinJ toxin-antitoxin module
MFLTQVVLQDGLPFNVRVPNAETRKAIEELEAGGGERVTGATKETFDVVSRVPARSGGYESPPIRRRIPKRP